MQDSERDQFDHSWKSAFDGAGMTPSDRLWNSIEMELAGNETAVMKRRVVFYQRLAAATVLFALLSGAYAVYTYKDSSSQVASTQSQQPGVSQQPRDQQPSSSQQEVSQPPANTLASGNVKRDAKSTQQLNTNSTSNAVNVTNSDATDATGSPLAANLDDPIAKDKVPSERSSESFDGNKVTAMTEVEEPNDNLLEEDEQPVKLLSAEEINALAEAEDKKDKEKTDRSPWLGLGGSAGSYAPSTVVSGGSLMASADQVSPNSFVASQGIPQSYSETIGSAYSAGVSAGFRIAKRWVVQSGVNYINQKVDYTTSYVGVSAANEAKAMTRDYLAETSYDVMVTNPYEVSSATEILSIPAQIGFLIINRKFGWQLNTGVSTDFLLRNTLTDKSGARGKISEGAGQDSPYRSVNGAALLNTELSYQIGNHYRIALVPGIRYSFKPMLKENAEGTPLVLDIGFRFNYLFN
jgi:hypothetical protein